MQKSGGEANSTKPSDQEKYARNISKFDQAKLKFDEIS